MFGLACWIRTSVVFVPNEVRSRCAKARLVGVPGRTRTGASRLKSCCPDRLDDGNLFATSNCQRASRISGRYAGAIKLVPHPRFELGKNWFPRPARIPCSASGARRMVIDSNHRCSCGILLTGRRFRSLGQPSKKKPGYLSVQSGLPCFLGLVRADLHRYPPPDCISCLVFAAHVRIGDACGQSSPVFPSYRNALPSACVSRSILAGTTRPSRGFRHGCISAVWVFSFIFLSSHSSPAIRRRPINKKARCSSGALRALRKA